jgi:hypothetical protein
MSADTERNQKNVNQQSAARGPLSTRHVSRIATTFSPMTRFPSILVTAEELLKRPGGVLYECTRGRRRAVFLSLLGIVVLCLLIYGLIAGIFSGGIQLWTAPLKIIVGMTLAAVICLPSLIVFSSLGGSEAGVREICELLIGVIALISLLLVGLAPVSWVFSQSTTSVVFMGFLHLLFWCVGVHHGLRFLRSALQFLDRKRTTVLFFWNLVFVLVSLQMTTTLRPIIGESDKLIQTEKKFFVTHWFECMEGKKDG